MTLSDRFQHRLSSPGPYGTLWDPTEACVRTILKIENDYDIQVLSFVCPD
jgi:hypothetical protein